MILFLSNDLELFRQLLGEAVLDGLQVLFAAGNLVIILVVQVQDPERILAGVDGDGDVGQVLGAPRVRAGTP